MDATREEVGENLEVGGWWWLGNASRQGRGYYEVRHVSCM